MKTNDQRLALVNWKFQIDQEDVGEAQGWHLPEHDHRRWMGVTVPGSWDFYAHALRDYEGVGWFHAEIPAFADAVQNLLEFTRVGGRAWIWVNGKPAGSNTLRYLPFTLDIQKHLNPAGGNQVVVKVDNSFEGEKHLTGGKRIEWALYGGLTHQVELVAAARCRLEHVDARADSSGEVDVALTVRNDGDQDFSGKLALGLDKQPRLEADIRCAAGRKTEVKLSLRAESFLPWSPVNPELHTLSASLLDGGEELHAASVRVGFRTIERRGAQILLNGEPLFLQGVNRYDEHEPYGSSVPEPLIREDLERIKHCGANLIRVHYPQDPVHLEIADELGLLYMLEVPLNWWNPDGLDRLEDFEGLQSEAKTAMDRTYQVFGNHPSWVFWSMSNECNYHNAAGIGMVRMLAERARKLNCGRLVTNVVNSDPSGTELDFCDFIGINLYEGAGKPLRTAAEREEHLAAPLRKRLTRLAGLYPDKPIVICEFGSLSVKGLTGESRMSEDHHADYLRCAAQAFRENANVRGMVLWAWADYFHNRAFLDLSPWFIAIHSLFGPYGVVTVDREIKEGPHQALIEIYGRN